MGRLSARREVSGRQPATITSNALSELFFPSFNRSILTNIAQEPAARSVRPQSTQTAHPAVSSRQPLFVVRQAGASDIPLLAHHRAAMFRDMGRLASHHEVALERATASHLRAALPRGEYLAWVAEDKGAPGSHCGCRCAT